MEVKVLRTKKELEIYMNPVRQEILRELRRAGEPVTPKYLSDRMGISPSSVQFHIRKLEELGVVELAGTKVIRGINARYFRPAEVMVSIGSVEDGLRKERELILENSVRQVMEGCLKTFREHPGEEAAEEKSGRYGDILTGAVFLTEEEAKDLTEMIRRFLETHGKKREGTRAWEYAVLAYLADGFGGAEERKEQ